MKSKNTNGRLRATESGGHHRDRKFVYFDRKPLKKLDVNDYRIVSRYKSVATMVADKNFVYQRDLEIPDMDGETIRELSDTVYTDKNSVFVEGWNVGECEFEFRSFAYRTPELLALSGHERETELVSKIRVLGNYLFQVFDRVFPVNGLFGVGYEELPYDEYLDAIPDCSISVVNDRLTLHYDGVEINGDLTAIVALFSRLWGIVRFNYKDPPYLTLALLNNCSTWEPGADAVQTALARTHPILLMQVATLLQAQGHLEGATETAVFVLLYGGRQRLSEPEIYTWLHHEIDIPEDIFDLYIPAKTSYLACIKELLTSDTDLNNKSFWIRMVRAQEFHACIPHVRNINTVMTRHSAQLVQFIENEEHDHVLEILLHCLDRLVGQYLSYDHFLIDGREEESKYSSRLLVCLNCLVEHGANLDLNLARYWECCVALDKEAEAEYARKALDKLLPANILAPAGLAVGIISSDYCYRSIQEWMLAAKARATRAWETERAITTLKEIQHDLQLCSFRPQDISEWQQPSYQRLVEEGLIIEPDKITSMIDNLIKLRKDMEYV